MQEHDTRPSNELPESSVIRMLLEQRQKVVAELNRIDRMLTSEGVNIQNLPFQIEPSGVTQRGRPRNTINKVDALLALLKSATRPLAQKELVAGIQNLGYCFASRNPVNTLNPLLYGTKKLAEIKKLPEGFILAEREKEFANQQSEQPSSQS